MNKAIIVVPALALILMGASCSLQTKPVENQPTSSPIILVGNNAINVETQVVGREVRVDFAILEAPGYVVIHKNQNGQPGMVIGYSTLLPKGRSELMSNGAGLSGPIALSEALVDGSSYFAMLHLDNGDGIYTKVDENLPAKDSLGNVIMMSFDVTTQPVE